MNKHGENKLISYLLIAFFVSLLIFSVVRADEENESGDAGQIVNAQQDAAVAGSKAVTKTIKEPDRIVRETQLRNFVVADSDKDGIADENDPHPNIAEIYIVKDDNFNGIVDSLE